MSNSPKKFKMSAASKAHIAAAAKARWAKIKANAEGDKLEVLPPVKMALNAILKTGDDAATAKQLNKLFAEAQNGMRRIVALGLFAWEVKLTKLKHGQWGTWLAQHCPKLSEVDANGKTHASRALRGYMDLTEGVLKNVGFPTIEKYLTTAALTANDAHLGHGKFLLIADKKVPEGLKPLREKIFELVDGKTQYALFTEFKQAEQDVAGNTKKKLGRVSGQGGATAEQRAAAAELEAQEIINERKSKAQEIADWLIEMSDDKGFGEILGTHELAILDKAMEAARGYIKHQGGGK